MVRYVDAGGDEHYVGLAEAAAVPFENCRMARNIPAYRDIAHTPGRYWAATTGELVEFESHLEEKWLTLLDFDAGITGFSSQPMELEAADEHGPWCHVPDIFARRADGSALLLDVKNRARLDDEQVKLQASRTAALCERLGWDYEMAGEPPAQRWANVFELSGKRRPLHMGDASLRLISPAAPADRRVITLPLAMLLSDPTFRPCTADEDPALDDEAVQVHRELTDTVAAMDGLARADLDGMERLAGPPRPSRRRHAVPGTGRGRRARDRRPPAQARGPLVRERPQGMIPVRNCHRPR